MGYRRLQKNWELKKLHPVLKQIRDAPGEENCDTVKKDQKEAQNQKIVLTDQQKFTMNKCSKVRSKCWQNLNNLRGKSWLWWANKKDIIGESQLKLGFCAFFVIHAFKQIMLDLSIDFLAIYYTLFHISYSNNSKERACVWWHVAGVLSIWG